MVPGTRVPGVKKAAIPDYYETIDINDIRSEAGAINVMGISGILDDFLGGENFKQTVSGRMASGKFTVSGESRKGGRQSAGNIRDKRLSDCGK